MLKMPLKYALASPSGQVVFSYIFSLSQFFDWVRITTKTRYCETITKRVTFEKL